MVKTFLLENKHKDTQNALTNVQTHSFGKKQDIEKDIDRRKKNKKGEERTQEDKKGEGEIKMEVEQ